MLFISKLRKLPNIRTWGTERAVPETLNQADKDWVESRYYLALEHIRTNDIVLDAACGSGFGSAIISQKAKLVYGVDISKEAIQYANIKFKSQNIKYVNGDVKNLRFKDSIFDISVGIETLEHINQAELYLKELKRVTRENGKIIISTPQKKSELLQTPYHVYEYEYEEFKKLLSSYYVIEEILGLLRSEKPSYSSTNNHNYKNFDIYLAFCTNTK
jgi:ubiquinone/menaquinone biosynthesis C-methylase UbiE